MAQAPLPPLEHAPSNVKAKINGGARNYEVQFTTDLSGATGWVTVPTTPGAAWCSRSRRKRPELQRTTNGGWR
ncbi:MAG: hypothetical protein M3Z22_02080 [Verrucomicrobiota bacterium]|nr:hypothetical protein [Verrucomicrobiota bacterium]